MDVEGTELVAVDFAVVEAGLLVVLGEEEDGAELPLAVVEEVSLGAEIDGAEDPCSGVLYQLASGSLRHSPAVTPFQPFALMRL